MSRAADSAAAGDTGASLVTAGSDAVVGMATVGKVAVVLVFIIALILLCSYLLKRLSAVRDPRSRLRTIASIGVGSRERIVVVEIEGTWLVVGVANGHMSKLHDLPAPEDRAVAPAELDANDSFTSRFRQALSRAAGQRLYGLRSDR